MSGLKVLNIGKKISDEFIYSENYIDGDWDSVISFGYREKIPKSILEKSRCINLHISYLPWNRGAHPNFWSYWDDTPKGITIHLMDEGIDTGNILVQELVDLSGTLRETHAQLESAIVALFIKNQDLILDAAYCGIPQNKNAGSFHKKRDIEPLNISWDMQTDDLIKVRALYYLDKIQEVRSTNNKNWMDVLRLAVNSNPDEAIPLIRKIAGCDFKINEFLKKI